MNQGSKLIIAAVGDIKRKLVEKCSIENSGFVLPGIISLNLPTFTSYTNTEKEIEALNLQLQDENLEGIMLIVICDDAQFVAQELDNFLWVTFTRSNPAKDIYGINSFTKHKHWGCKGPLIIDARIKPHHAPPLIKNKTIEQKLDKLGEKGASLYGII